MTPPKLKAGEIAFPALCRAFGLPEPEAEHLFAKCMGRKWRFDWAWKSGKVAVEVQGGLFVQGRHSRGAALLKEHEKLNAAAILGWRVLFTTPRDIASGAILDDVRAALEGKQ